MKYRGRNAVARWKNDLQRRATVEKTIKCL